MPRVRRIKTGYPGVYYVLGRSLARTGKPERIYYIRYRKNGKEVEVKAGRQFKDSMTPEKAATIRTELIEGKRFSRKAINEQMKVAGTTLNTLRIPMSKKEIDGKLLEQKWLLFMESATDSFFLYDSDLNLIEVNQAGLRLFPAGTKKTDIIGKNLEDFLPHTKKTGEYEAHLKVIRTGQRYEVEAFTPLIRPDMNFNLRIFKVGDGAGVIVTDITELKRKEAELEAKASELEETNTALKVLLKRREKDKTELQEDMVLNIKELVQPYLEKLKNSKLSGRQESYVNIVESNLENIISPFVRQISMTHMRLTPTEIQIATLVKQGKTAKEIAGLLNLSVYTIASYRKNIRNKLGITNKKANLRTYLLSSEK